MTKFWPSAIKFWPYQNFPGIVIFALSFKHRYKFSYFLYGNKSCGVLCENHHYYAWKILIWSKFDRTWPKFGHFLQNLHFWAFLASIFHRTLLIFFNVLIILIWIKSFPFPIFFHFLSFPGNQSYYRDILIYYVQNGKFLWTTFFA
jgi:hypothetical protein